MRIFGSGSWYRGNLHAHTTRSDGKASPEECRALYRAAGYDFLAITDHSTYGPGGMYDGLLVIPAIELHHTNWKEIKTYHFVGLGVREGVMDADMDFPGGPQSVIDHIRRNDGFVITCHPDWSLLSPEDVLKLHDQDAIEIMNSATDPDARGNSSRFIDTLMARGMILPHIASDDRHGVNEHCVSSTWVNAPSLDTESVFRAIKSGQSYASNGPKFLNIEVLDGSILVECTPVVKASFFSERFWVSGQRHVKFDYEATVALYKVDPKERFLRIELTDALGRQAWSNFIDLREYV